MPNWCSQKVMITGDSKDLDYLEKIKCSFMELLPCPEELRKVGSGYSNGKPYPSKKQQKQFIKKYGSKDWYDWNCNNWGTKWDIHLTLIKRINKHTLFIEFDTAWSLPRPIYELITNKFNVMIDGRCAEEGGFFAGHFTVENGVINDDELFSNPSEKDYNDYNDWCPEAKDDNGCMRCIYDS